MGNRWVAVLVAAVFFAVAFLILLQQEVTFGEWFQIEDLHHETFAIAAAALGVGVLVGAVIAASNEPELGSRTAELQGNVRVGLSWGFCERFYVQSAVCN